MAKRATPVALLAAGVPLSLLADLVQQAPPDSGAILDSERPDAEELAWIAPQTPATER